MLHLLRFTLHTSSRTLLRQSFDMVDSFRQVVGDLDDVGYAEPHQLELSKHRVAPARIPKYASSRLTLPVA